MKIIKSFIFILFVLYLFGCSTSSIYVGKATWKDEFRGNGAPNSRMWSRSITKPGGQLSAYRDDDRNAYVRNGLLHLRVYKTDDLDMAYKAGRVIASQEFHFKKGKLVVRAKAPTTPGLWPAIWLNGPKTKDGYFAELDLMEHIHAMGDSCYEAVYHLWGDFRGKVGNHV